MPAAVLCLDLNRVCLTAEVYGLNTKFKDTGAGMPVEGSEASSSSGLCDSSMYRRDVFDCSSLRP